MLRRSLSPLLSAALRRSRRRLFTEILAPPPPPPAAASVDPPEIRENDSGDSGSRPAARISVDRSSLFTPPVHCHKPTEDSELVKHLKSIIKFRGGPISVAEYMEEVLTNPQAGFYINRDVFGAGGDFITSPEVSQMFGEMVGVWTMSLWEQMGQPKEVNLVELGPGRGTLMADLLRGSSKFENFTKSLNIHLVECSPTLQKLQYSTLKCMDEVDKGGDSKGVVSMLSGGPVSWHATMEQVPVGLPTIIIAHEFYDALPIHQFQAIRKHKFVGILDDPGSADLSAYVDFASIRHSAEETSENVSVHGPITQSQFLGSLGINFRIEALLENCTEEQAESLRTGYWRLVGDGEAPFWEGPEEQTPIGMGTQYQAIAIVNKKQGVPVPFE